MTISISNKRIRNRLILLTIGLLFLGFCLLTILPWNAPGYGFDLDQSWAIALHVAFAEGFQFGTDFIYTYGPYGFIQVGIYHPETYPYLFALRLLIAVAVWAGLFKLARYCIVRRDGAVVFLVPLLLFFFIGVSIESFQFIVVVLPLVLYFYVSKRLSPALVLTIATLALTSLTKQTHLLLGVFFVVLITVDELIKLKRPPQVAILYAVFVWIFWTFAGQELVNFPAYIWNGLQIVRGFSQAMGIAGNFDEILLYVLGTGLFLLLIGLIEWRSRRWWGILPTLGLAAVFFITFKGAFTRHDSHALQAFLNIMPLVLIFTAVLWSQIKHSSWQWHQRFKLPGIAFWSVCLTILLTMSYIIQDRYFNFESGGYVTNALKSPVRKLPLVANFVTGKTDLTANVEPKKNWVRTSNLLPPTSGTVDLYPNEIASIFAYDLPYQPRPVFQSFLAYTKELARLNAEHLTTPDAAESILFDINPIDEHLASFEDGLSWPELLTRYDITNIEGRYLLLERSRQPRQYSLEPLDRQTVALGEWYEIPNNSQPAWAQLDLHPNFWGKLAAIALRLPPLYLEIETADGIQIEYRAVPKLLEVGFLLSPVVSTRWDFLALTTTDWQQTLATQQATRFRIVDEGINSWLYPKDYQVAMSQLQFSRQDFKGVIGWQDWSGQIAPQLVSGTLKRIPFAPQKFVWFAHAPTRLSVELKDTKQNLSFEFGLLDEAIASALEKKAGDGVEFKIIVEQNNQEKVLFSRHLQPGEIADRGIQQATVDLTGVDATRIILETVSGQDNQWDWSYWSELKAE